MNTIPELAAAYRQLWDELDIIDQQKKELASKMSDIERRIGEAMRNAGKVEGDAERCGGLMMTVQLKFRAAYSPEKWPDIMRWCVENGHNYLIQRRLSDGKILDLVDAGVALPDGLTLEPYTDLAMRRV